MSGPDESVGRAAGAARGPGGAIRVRLELSPWLADLAGFRETDVDLPRGATVGDALASFASRLEGGRAAALAARGALHPSVLAFVDGAIPGDGRGRVLSGGEVIRLLLPSAGG